MVLAQAIQKVTPQIASEWLESQMTNRPRRTSTIDWYARQMSDGRWKFTGEAIKFDSFGRLIDGQHRLSAVIQANVELDFLVVTGLDQESQLYMDSGIRRSTADGLSLTNIDNAGLVAASLAVIWGYEQTGILTYSFASTDRSRRPNTNQLVSLLQKHRGLPDSIAFISGRKREARLLASDSINAVTHYLFTCSDYDNSLSFWESHLSGESLTKNDPVYLLRSRLLQNRMSKLGKLPVRHIYALYIKAWNSYVAGKSLGQLSWKTGGLNPEEFPSITPLPFPLQLDDAA